MNQQSRSFQAGERHGLEKRCQRILEKLQEGLLLTTADLVALIQKEINLEVEDAAVTYRVHFPNQPSQFSIQPTNPSDQTPSGLFGEATTDQLPK